MGAPGCKKPETVVQPEFAGEGNKKGRMRSMKALIEMRND